MPIEEGKSRYYELLEITRDEIDDNTIFTISTSSTDTAYKATLNSLSLHLLNSNYVADFGEVICDHIESSGTVIVSTSIECNSVITNSANITSDLNCIGYSGNDLNIVTSGVFAGKIIAGPSTSNNCTELISIENVNIHTIHISGDLDLFNFHYDSNEIGCEHIAFSTLNSDKKLSTFEICDSGNVNNLYDIRLHVIKSISDTSVPYDPHTFRYIAYFDDVILGDETEWKQQAGTQFWYYSPNVAGLYFFFIYLPIEHSIRGMGMTGITRSYIPSSQKYLRPSVTEVGNTAGTAGITPDGFYFLNDIIPFYCVAGEKYFPTCCGYNTGPPGGEGLFIKGGSSASTNVAQLIIHRVAVSDYLYPY